MTEKQRIFWLLFVKFHKNRVIERDSAWFNFKRKVKNGWTDTAVREFKELSKPSLRVKSYYDRYLPPSETDEVDDLLSDFEVVFPHLKATWRGFIHASRSSPPSLSGFKEIRAAFLKLIGTKLDWEDKD